MRSIAELEESIKNLTILHGEDSLAVSKETSLLGIAWMQQQNFEKALECFTSASKMVKPLKQYAISEDGLDVEYRLGVFLENHAITSEQMTEAQEILEKVKEERIKFDEDNNTLAKAVNNQGLQPFGSEEEEMDSTLVYYNEALKKQEAGSLNAAVDLYERCLTLRKAKFGAESPANVTVSLGYADTLRDKGHFQKAKSVLNDALMHAVKGRGRTTLKVAEVLNNLGNLLRIMAEFSAAREALNESLSIRKEILGEVHIQVAASYNNIAELYREEGDLLQAVKFHHLAMSNFESSVGKDHPGTINAKGNYGITMQRLAKISSSDGDNYLNEAIEFMHINGFEGKHPWLVNFSNEHILLDARRFWHAGSFYLSSERYNTLLERKRYLYDQEKGEKVEKKLSPLETVAVEKIRMERFEMMVDWCRASVDRNNLTAAKDILSKCEDFVAESLPKELKERQHIRLISEINLIKARLSYFQSDFANSLSLATHSLEITDQVFDGDDIVRAKPLLFLAEINCDLANFQASDGYSSMVSKQ